MIRGFFRLSLTDALFSVWVLFVTILLKPALMHTMQPSGNIAVPIATTGNVFNGY